MQSWRSVQVSGVSDDESEDIDDDEDNDDDVEHNLLVNHVVNVASCN
jgi:hypothetical protein